MGLLIITCSIIGLLTGLVLLIVGLAGTGKTRLTYAGTILSVVAVFSLIFGVYFSVKKTASRIGNFFTNVIEKADSTTKANAAEMALPEDDWENTGAGRNQSIAYLKSLVPDSERMFVRKAFFRKFHYSDHSRYPLVYPYALHKSFFDPSSTLVNERAMMDTRDSAGKSENVILNITHLIFDGKMMLVKTADYDFNSNSNTTNQKFILYEFGKAGIFEFKSERELTDAATKSGYTGSFDFYTVVEYSRRFSGM